MAKFKVVVQAGAPTGGALDNLGRPALDLERSELDAVDAELVEVEAGSEEEFIEAARDADAIYARGRRITANIIQNLQKCMVIGNASIGTDAVDVEAATAAGIVVTNVPDMFIEEVGDHTFALLLASSRRLKLMEEMIHDGRWGAGRPHFMDIPRLLGQTLGLVAFGNAAQAVARRAQAFNMRVLAYDPYIGELEMTKEGVEPVGFDELLERSDFVSMHTPLNDETRGMMSTKQFERMKPTAIYLNNGRGPTTDEAALIKALQDGQIAGAGLDVLEQEPPDLENPLLHMTNVAVTPHIASASARMMPETRRRAGREMATVLSGRWPRSCVNPTVLPRTQLERWQPYPMTRGPNR